MANQLQKDILAKNLKYQLHKKGLSQTDLARILNYPEMTVSNWVNAKYYPRIDKIQELSDFFGINKSDLIEDKLSTTPTLSNEEEVLLKNYNNSNTKGKNIIIDTSFTIVNTYPKIPPREDMIEYLKEFKTAAYGGGKNYYQMNDDELFSLYKELKEAFEDE